MDTRAYWKQVRDLQAKLPAECWIVSVEDRLNERIGGQIVAANPEVSAKAILSGSHRLADVDEIAAYHAGQVAKARFVRAEAYRKAGIAPVLVPLVSPKPSGAAKKAAG